MKQFIIACLITLSLPLSAQTAKVIPLSADDAVQAKQLQDAKVAANKAYDEFNKKITEKYTIEEKEGPSTACITMLQTLCEPPKATEEQKKKNRYKSTKSGWEYGFTYSEDFKYIVPQESASKYVGGGTSPLWGCNVYTTPYTQPVTPGVGLTIGTGWISPTEWSISSN